ncbi:DUF4199 domain-containing protein [Flavobacteriaceae bacterium 3-367]
MKNYMLRYGLWGGGISIGLGLINWFTVAQIYGPGVSQVIGYLSIVLSLMCVPLGIKYFRDKLNRGKLTFAHGFKIGSGITLIASLVTFLYSILFFELAGERFDEWSRKGLSETEIGALEAQLLQSPDFVYTSWFQGFVLFLTVFLIGMIINLISSLLLKRSDIGTP